MLQLADLSVPRTKPSMSSLEITSPALANLWTDLEIRRFPDTKSLPYVDLYIISLMSRLAIYVKGLLI